MQQLLASNVQANTDSVKDFRERDLSMSREPEPHASGVEGLAGLDDVLGYKTPTVVKMSTYTDWTGCPGSSSGAKRLSTKICPSPPHSAAAEVTANWQKCKAHDYPIHMASKAR